MSFQRFWGLSDFVAESIIRYPSLLTWLFKEQGLTQESLDYSALLYDELSELKDESTMFQALRHFRCFHMVRLAWLDLSNRQSITQSLMQVSELADALITQSLLWLQKQLEARYGSPADKDGNHTHLIVLGMGKLGGKELNFSSDIDLIFSFPAAGETQGGKKSIENQQFFIKLAQKLIASLNNTTIDGQVFRVDMRLRPFGESGPLVANFSALEDYYQEQGREWERFAMVKARVINAETAGAETLKDLLKPFVYRRYLDFSAIESLRQMKQLINQEVRRRKLADNIKLGAGGIREVEFIAQSFQLIRGGRAPLLQTQSLLTVLNRLPDEGVLSEAECRQLRQSYLFLRKVEHCLQQFADKQTQTLPDNAEDKARLCHVMDFEDYSSFKEALAFHLHAIHHQFVLLIGEPDALDDPLEDDMMSLCQDIWQLPLSLEEIASNLADANAEYADNIATIITETKADLAKKTLGPKGTESLNKLLPLILHDLADFDQSRQSDLLRRLLAVIHSVTGRTTYLELMVENAGVRNQLSKLCDASPWIAEQITRFPLLLDELISPQLLYSPTPLQSYSDELRQSLLRVEPDDLEQQMESMRQYKLSHQLKIAAADVTGVLPVMKVSDHLTYLAEAVLGQVVADAWQQMSNRYGSPQGKTIEDSGFGVLGYGKLGGIELGYGSDLDLVFIHDNDSKGDTDGPKPISTLQFYIKLAQRIMHLLNTKTLYGELYEADMRLRPSGNSGLLVCHIDGFETYQREEAWTWEHQALTRARFVWGSASLQEKFTRVREHILTKERTSDALKKDVSDMREKMRGHLSDDSKEGIDLKQDKGGIADIEFLVQFWVLQYGYSKPNVTYWSDNVRVLESLAEEGIISAETSTVLTDAYLLFRNTNHHLVLAQQSRAKNNEEITRARNAVCAVWEDVFHDKR